MVVSVPNNWYSYDAVAGLSHMSKCIQNCIEYVYPDIWYEGSIAAKISIGPVGRVSAGQAN